MNTTTETKYLGVDLAQHRVRLACIRGGKVRPIELPAAVAGMPPSVVLPMYQGEDALYGIQALAHRRGRGWPWPPESVVPYAGNPDFGAGRQSLMSAWVSLFGGERESGLIRPTLSWEPKGQPLSVSAEDALVGSAHAFTEAGGEDWLTLVVPDNLDEAAQQALVDAASRRPGGASGFRLLWRSVALAMSWCRAFGDSFQGKGVQEEEGRTLGHIVTLHMGLDAVDLRLLTITARQFMGKTILVPIRDRTMGDGALGVWGSAVAVALAACDAPAGETDQTLWERLVGGDWLDLRLGQKRSPSLQESRCLDETLLTGKSASIARMLRSMPWLEMYPAGTPLIEGGNFEKRICDCYRKQAVHLAAEARTCLGAIFDGSLIPLCLREHESIGERLRRILPLGKEASPRLLVGGGERAAEGAARFSWRVGRDGRDQPTYRERLVPIDIYSLGKDQSGDPKEVWLPLVEGRTVEASQEYRLGTPITCLSIPKGHDALRMILRRPKQDDAKHGDSDYKTVSQQITRPVKQEEPVELTVRVQPGQGYAKVSIRSKQPGLFGTMLDWSKMEKSKAPKLELAYIPGVMKIEPDRNRWLSAQGVWAEALDALERRPFRLESATERLNSLCLDYLNKTQDQGDGFTLWGIVGSDGKGCCSLENEQIHRSAELIAQQTESRWHDKEFRQQLVRTAGYLYLKMPEAVRERLREIIRAYLRLDFESPDRYEVFAAGLGFCTRKDMKLFFRAARLRFEEKLEGTNVWLASIRNLVRFRDDALHPAVIGDDDIMSIARAMRDIIIQQIQQRSFHMIFNNCLTSFVYMLKRRRYDETFLDPESTFVSELTTQLATVTRKRGAKESQEVRAMKATDFLFRRASAADVPTFAGDTDSID